jgi:phospholipase C
LGRGRADGSPLVCLNNGSGVAGSWFFGEASGHPEKGVVMHGTIGRQCRYWAIGGLAAVVGLAVLVSPAGPARANSRQDLKNFQHVFVIMMENTGFDSLIGNPNAPWINQTAQKHGLATNYFGVTHPSQPNYIAATSGSTNGVTSDDDVTINVPNIVDQLEAHGKTWKAYMQSFALCATPFDHACGNQLYERKHNPFVSYLDVQSNPARMANIVDLSQFFTDLAANTVPDFVWISPD